MREDQSADDQDYCYALIHTGREKNGDVILGWHSSETPKPEKKWNKLCAAGMRQLFIYMHSSLRGDKTDF